MSFDGEKINKDLPGIVDDWKKYRLRIYEETKNINKQRELLKEFALDEEFDYYLKLKKSYDCDIWKTVFPIIIAEIKKKKPHYGSYYLLRIFVEENQIGDLLNEIKKEPSNIEDFEKYLLKDYPSEVYSLYKI